MQTVSYRDSLHEMSKPNFPTKIKKEYQSISHFAEFAQRVIMVNGDTLFLNCNKIQINSKLVWKKMQLGDFGEQDF